MGHPHGNWFDQWWDQPSDSDAHPTATDAATKDPRQRLTGKLIRPWVYRTSVSALTATLATTMLVDLTGQPRLQAALVGTAAAGMLGLVASLRPDASRALWDDTDTATPTADATATDAARIDPTDPNRADGLDTTGSGPSAP